MADRTTGLPCARGRPTCVCTHLGGLITLTRLSKKFVAVQELADQSLAVQIEATPLTVDRARFVIRECAAGLKYLHDMGCVHRDVKPHNILRFGDRYVLGDLGIVRWDDMNPAFTSAGTITKASVQLGSWYYMAHEQRVVPHEATAASDIYALGISWYEMLTGDTPDPFVKCSNSSSANDRRPLTGDVPSAVETRRRLC